MFHKIKEVKPVQEYKLLVTFADGIVKLYDIEPLFSIWDAFSPLQAVPGLFRQVKVDVGGYGISWNDDIDLECDELWENGVEMQEQVCV